MPRSIFRCTLFQIIVALSGCAGPNFALKPIPTHADSAGSLAMGWPYDSNGDGKVDFRILPGPDGRAATLIYGEGGQAEKINLADIPADEKRHLVLILDGFGYDFVREYYDAGHLRYCAPPSRVIAPYPTLTDLCLNDALGAGVSDGFEAEYYDPTANKIVGGSWAYLQASNMPYNALLDYRADLITDALSYLFPWYEFKVELWSVYQQFNAESPDEDEYLAYFVSLAGLGTRNGVDGHRRALDMLDQFVADVLWRSKGRVAVTIFSDHGHSYTVGKRVEIEAHLQQQGWRLRDKLSDPRDVVYIRFGLETYASFATQRPADLAADLMAVEGVEIASFNEDDHVVVLGRDGQRAHIREADGEYSYETISGDPLKFRGVLSMYSPQVKDTYPADWLLEASAKFEYPAALQRLWRAHRGGLARHTPDVIISLGDAWYSGSKGFAGAVEVKSTHGGLNYRNSATFIMTSLGELPPVLRSRDIPANMADLLNAPAWPLKRNTNEPTPD